MKNLMEITNGDQEDKMRTKIAFSESSKAITCQIEVTSDNKEEDVMIEAKRIFIEAQKFAENQSMIKMRK